MSLLFSGTTLGPLALQNRLVMAPLTRSRAIGNIPNDLMVNYYAQHASAGLIITEGTSPSPNGLGYARIPGIYSAEQVAGWKQVTTAVHPAGAKIFVQLMHCGRVAHPLNLPAGARILGPSAVAAAGEMFTDAKGLQPNATPAAMTEADIKSAIDEYAQAAKNAVAAGFDGVELHGANGYLLEQFFRPTSNRRTDRYGGSIENRARFVLEVTRAAVGAIGKDKVGIRLSPFGAFNDMPAYPTTEADYTYLAGELDAIGLVYIHLVDHSSMGAPPVPESMKATFRRVFKRTLILSGGYDAVRAEGDLEAGKCDLVAFGRPFLANPDLVARWKAGAALNAPDMSTFYTPGPKGYTDYPTLSVQRHNLRESGPRAKEPSAAFDRWLQETLPAVSPAERITRLVEWEAAPAARRARLQEDHLLPLMVVVGAAGNDKAVMVPLARRAAAEIPHTIGAIVTRSSRQPGVRQCDTEHRCNATFGAVRTEAG